MSITTSVAYSGAIPAEGPKSMKVPLDFSVAASFSFDISQYMAQGRFSGVQAIFVDTTENDAIYITAEDSGQTIIAPAGTQGYYPILSANGKFTASCTSFVPTSVILINFPIAQSTWSTI